MAKYRAIIGRKFPDGHTEDVRWEEIDAYCYRNAHEAAIAIIRSTPPPESGKFFLRCIIECG